MSSKKKDSFKPWLSRPAINRSVTIPFTTSLTHRLSSLGEFHPNELDPFLLFDARDSMIGTLENPTLDLDPSKPDTLNVITATRAGTATFTDANGLIASASPNTVRVDQTQGAELTPTVYQRVNYTDFSQGWGNVNSTFVDGSGFSGNSSKILTGTSSSGAVDTAVITADGVTYTGSIYIRRVNGTGNLEFAIYGSASSDVTPLFTESVSTDWIRVDLQFLGKSGGGNVYFGVKIQQSGDSVEIAMPQVEEGTTASSFVANTTGSPKFITGATFGPRVPMILVEPSSENLLPYSEDFSQSFWTKRDITLSSGFSAPDGSMNASKLVANAADSSLFNVFTVASGTTYSISFYLKTISGSLETTIGLGSPGFPQNEGEGGRYKNITVTDEWQRFTLTSTADASAATSVSFGGFNGFSTGEEVYIWGAQLEAGSVATSYIPTSGSTVTRAADDLVISGSAFSDFYNQSEGTIYTEFVPRRVDYYQHLYEFSDGSANNRINVHLESANARFYLTSGGTVYANTIAATNVTTGELHRTGFSYKTNDAPASFDGSTEITDVTVTVPSGIDKVFLGALYTQANDFYLNGHIKRLIYWPTHSDSL